MTLLSGSGITNLQPDHFKLENSTVWSFPNRGDWATHTGAFRGNWSPYVPRNLILRYSKQGDCVLDQFMGSGTTLVEAKLLNRKAIGIDINPQNVELAKRNLNFNWEAKEQIAACIGDAANLNSMQDDSIDFICTHPPYANIIKYSEGINGDMSLLSVSDFLQKIQIVADESYRVLKKGKCCAVMMGDIRRHGNVIPLGFYVMDRFVQSGFRNKEIIIKQQHNCSSTQFWQRRNNDFLLLAHEYIFVFEK